MGGRDKKLLSVSTLCGPAPRSTLLLAATEKTISPLIPSVFLAMHYRLDALTQPNPIRAAQQEEISRCTRGIGSPHLWKGKFGVR